MNVTAEEKTSDRLLYVALLAVCAIFLLSFPILFDRGIDLTDEGAYLNSIATPGLYPYSLSLYGYFYHPLLRLFQGDIASLRSVNYVILVSLTFILVRRAARFVGLNNNLDSISRAGLWAAFTTSALFFYCIWLPTPSYNSLNLSGALLLAYAIIGIASRRQSPIGEIIIGGIGLSLCALTKPTSGASLAIVLLVSCAGARANYFRSIIWIGIFSAALSAAFLIAIHGSPSAIINSYQKGVILADGLLGNRSALDIYFWRSIPYPMELLYIVLVCAVAVLSFFAVELRAQVGRWNVPLQVGAFLILLTLCVYVQFRADWWNRPLNWTPILFAISIAICNAMAARRVDGKHLSLALTLLAFPFAVGLGSNTGLLRSATQAAPLWAVGSLFFLSSTSEGARLKTYAAKVALSLVISAGVVVGWAICFPQRQAAPLWAQTTWMNVRGKDHALRVDSATEAYFRKLGTLARVNRFTASTPIIDLTGTSPATIYVLGGEAIGSSYFSGGWPGSEWMVETSLNSVARSRLAQAWILTREKTSDSINPEVLRKVGLHFPEGYEVVSNATPPTAAGSQTLWRPKNLQRSFRLR